MLTRDRIAEAFDSKLRGMALPRDRSPQGRGDVELPDGTTIISCDNHWSSDADIFHERFPAHLKHKAPRPRITNEGTSQRFIEWEIEGQSLLNDLGIKTISLPMNPKGAEGQPLNYCVPEMDPLWAAVADAGLPVCFHIGEFWRDGPGAFATAVMVSLGPFRQTMGELMFGGIFDRHPALRVVFLEAEINWIPGALQTASMLYECFMPLLDPKIKWHPREYWHENCYAGFIHDPAGLAMLPTIGADRVMWSADFPHQESSYGFSWSVIREVLESTTENEARMILGGTAQKLFKLD